jgi:Domain of unknown function (DUF4172)
MARRIERELYIHELKGWPDFRWDNERISARLVDVRYRQGRLFPEIALNLKTAVT